MSNKMYLYAMAIKDVKIGDIILISFDENGKGLAQPYCADDFKFVENQFKNFTQEKYESKPIEIQVDE